MVGLSAEADGRGGYAARPGTFLRLVEPGSSLQHGGMNFKVAASRCGRQCHGRVNGVTLAHWNPGCSENGPLNVVLYDSGSDHLNHPKHRNLFPGVIGICQHDVFCTHRVGDWSCFKPRFFDY
jgi:hypothetical protein